MSGPSLLCDAACRLHAFIRLLPDAACYTRPRLQIDDPWNPRCRTLRPLALACSAWPWSPRSPPPMPMRAEEEGSGEAKAPPRADGLHRFLQPSPTPTGSRRNPLPPAGSGCRRWASSRERAQQQQRDLLDAAMQRAAGQRAEAARRLLGQRPGRSRGRARRRQADRAAARRASTASSKRQGRRAGDRRAAPGRHPGRVQLQRRHRPAATSTATSATSARAAWACPTRPTTRAATPTRARCSAATTTTCRRSWR